MIFPYDKQLPLKQLPESLRQQKVTFWQPPWSFSARPWFWTSPELGKLPLFNSPSRDDPMAKSLGNDDIYIYILVGGAITILKNDGVRQWEGLIPYIMDNKKCWKPQTSIYIYTLMYPSFRCWNVVEHVGSRAFCRKLRRNCCWTILRRCWGSNIRPPCLLLHQRTHSPYLVVDLLLIAG